MSEIAPTFIPAFLDLQARIRPILKPYVTQETLDSLDSQMATIDLQRSSAFHQLEAAKDRAEKLQEEVDTLRAELARLEENQVAMPSDSFQRPESFDDVTDRMILHFRNTGSALDESDLMHALALPLGDITHHLTILRNVRYIQEVRLELRSLSIYIPAEYKLTAAGTAYAQKVKSRA